MFLPEIMSSWKPLSMTSLQSRMPKWNAEVSANHNRERLKVWESEPHTYLKGPKAE